MITKLWNNVRTYMSSEAGAMTVEYLVLTAGAAGIALASSGAIRSSTTDMSSNVGTSVSAVETASEF